MSQENVELVRAMNEAFDEGDIEGALAKLHPEVEWHGTKGGLDDGKVFRGHREVIAGFVEALEVWERQSLETTDYFDAGDRVVVFFHEVAKGRQSGAVVETNTGVIFTVKGGSVARVDPYMDRAEPSKPPGCRSSRFGREAALPLCMESGTPPSSHEKPRGRRRRSSLT